MQGIDLMTDGNARAEQNLEVYSEEDHEGNVLWSLRTKTIGETSCEVVMSDK